MSKEDNSPVKRRYNDSGWRFWQEGNVLHGENMRYRYSAILGEVYAPKKPYAGDSEPKRLGQVFTGDKWRVELSATTDAGRHRLVELGTFFVRYTEAILKPKKRQPSPTTVKDKGRLLRIERKLDLLMKELGVKFTDDEEKTQ
jgi:hypothetical protein